MKKWVVIGLIVLVWANTAYGNPAQKRGGADGALQAKTPAVKEDPYKAYIVVEAGNGRVLEGENVSAKRAPASVIKLMLACIVLEKIAKGEAKFTDQVTISQSASKIGGSQVYLKEGEVFTLEDLMRATIVASANDAACAVAEHIAGTKEAFVRLMNEKAKSLGMVDTEIYSVHGLPPAKGQKEDMTSCNDLVILVRELLKYPKIFEWTSLKTESFRDGQFTLTNHNKLLGKMPGVIDGLKTGYYREAGFNIVATGKKNDLRFIVIVMGSPTAKIRDNIALDKFKKIFSHYKILNLVKKGELIDKDIVLEDGKYRKIKGIASTGFVYPLPSDKKGTIKKEVSVPEKIKGEVREGQKLGELLIKIDNDIIGKVDIVSAVYVPKANLFTRLIRMLGLNI